MSMLDIGREMRFGSASRGYREYLEKKLYPREGMPTKALADPFAIDLRREYTAVPLVSTANDVADFSYVIRERVQQNVLQPGSRIIMGREGSGLTTLAQWINRNAAKTPYIDKIPYVDKMPYVDKTPYAEGAISILLELPDLASDEDALKKQISFHWLASAIWRAFVQQYILDDGKWGRIRPYFWPSDDQNVAQAKSWRHTMLWWGRHWAGTADQELLAQLEDRLDASATVPDGPMSPWVELNRVCQLVHDAANFYGSIPRCIRLIIDASGLAVDDLHNPDLKENSIPLLQSLTFLCQRGPADIQVLLMASISLQAWVLRLPIVCSGRLGIYEIEEWSEEELQSLLELRLALFRPPEKQWLTPIAHPVSHDSMLSQIIRGGLRAYNTERAYTLDAPVHTLRIARGILLPPADAGSRSSSLHFPSWTSTDW